jgi:uncharacterized protein (DUF2249 family)
MRLDSAERAVDLHQGDCGRTEGMVAGSIKFNPSTHVRMPPLSKFKKFDVRPLLAKGQEPLPEITRRIEKLKADEGLIVIAPFLPSPLIEKLGSEGFESKLEPAQDGHWVVYFWRQD